MLNQPNKKCCPTDRDHSYKTPNWNKYKPLPVIYTLRNAFSEIILLWESENKTGLMILVPTLPHKEIISSQVVLVVKNLPANAGDIIDLVQSPNQEDPLEEGNSYSLQYSCLENPMDRRVWQATVYRAAKSWTQLKWLSTHAKKL